MILLADRGRTEDGRFSVLWVFSLWVYKLVLEALYLKCNFTVGPFPSSLSFFFSNLNPPDSSFLACFTMPTMIMK